MKITTASLSLLALALSAGLQAAPLDNKQIQQLGPIDSITADSDQQSAIDATLINQLRRQAERGQGDSAVSVFGASRQWQSLATTAADGRYLFRLPIRTDRFTQGKLSLSGLDNPSLYVNGELQTGSDGVYSLNLANGDYDLLVMAGHENGADVAFDWQGDSDLDQLGFYQSGERRVYPKQLYDSQTISRLNIAPNGKQLLWQKRHYNNQGGDKAITTSELLALPKRQVLYRWQGSLPGSIAWSPDNQQVAYVLDGQITLLDRATRIQTPLSDKLKGVSGLRWYGEDQLIFSWNKGDESGNDITKHYRALEDRWSSWRDNSQLYRMDIRSGLIRQLTQGKQSHALLDVDADEGKLLLSKSLVDYREPAHYLTELLELEMADNKLTSLGQFRTFGDAQYGKKGIYLLAGPGFAGGKGAAAKEGLRVNNYDTQLYRHDAKGNFIALSKDFNPSIDSMTVLKNGNLVLKVTDEDRKQLYSFNARRDKFKKLKTGLDIVESVDASQGSATTLVYRGTSATEPQRAYSLSLKNGKRKVLFDSAKAHYADSKLGELKEWNFTNQRGEEIAGRVYLPTDFDANKRYPALVYYYGGTSPVSRGFTGRYPFNLWAAQGYVVYVLQPAGATGFGQTFSGRHVNAWGEYTTDDIIEGTKKFLDAHPFVDEKRVGNLGASYGGFTTMLLATKTDIFAASLSHAGISNLSNYWGYGWWGYLYSGVASEGSFPWNNRQLYVEQSPLYHADKVTKPMLLIHGDQDTNVPVSESHSMYTALKLLGKDVDLIEFKGQDHTINQRTQRLVWWNTVLAYFDKHLKQQPQWWQYLYPEK